MTLKLYEVERGEYVAALSPEDAVRFYIARLEETEPVPWSVDFEEGEYPREVPVEEQRRTTFNEPDGSPLTNAAGQEIPFSAVLDRFNELRPEQEQPVYFATCRPDRLRKGDTT